MVLGLHQAGTHQNNLLRTFSRTRAKISRSQGETPNGDGFPALATSRSLEMLGDKSVPSCSVAGGAEPRGETPRTPRLRPASSASFPPPRWDKSCRGRFVPVFSRHAPSPHPTTKHRNPAQRGQRGQRPGGCGTGEPRSRAPHGGTRRRTGEKQRAAGWFREFKQDLSRSRCLFSCVSPVPGHHAELQQCPPPPRCPPTPSGPQHGGRLPGLPVMQAAACRPAAHLPPTSPRLPASQNHLAPATSASVHTGHLVTTAPEVQAQLL